ncbi:MAG: competence protein CoiA family protein [Candidatus Gracilibacteria bacterium]|nr:competence protein CoiA family protein [Candidatus Gracilibacteria bacterium]
MKDEKASKGVSYAVHSETGEVIEVESFDNNLKGFICCPYCLKDVSFKKGHITNKDGTIRKSHYFHLNSECSENKVGSLGESELHKKGKDYIIDLIKNISETSKEIEFKKITTEYQIKDEKLNIERIADIYLEYIYKGETFKKVIEIQYSNIPELELQERHENYKALGIEDIWIIGYLLEDKEYIDKNLDNNLFSFIGNIDFEKSEGDELYNKEILIDTTNPEDHLWLSEYIKPNQIYKHIKSKTLALASKISTFQNYTYFIDENGLSIISNLKAEFCGDKFENDIINHPYKHVFDNNINNIFNIRNYTIKFNKLNNINNIRYNYHLIYLKNSDIGEDFILNGDIKLFDYNLDEINFKKESLSYYENIFNSLIEEEKASENEYNEVLINTNKGVKYFYKTLLELILKFQFVITFYKDFRGYQKSPYSKLNDMMINHGLDYNLKGKYGFYSGFNKTYKSIIHRSNDFVTPPELVEQIERLLKYLENVKFDLYSDISFQGFLNYFNNIKPRIELDEDGYTIEDEDKGFLMSADIDKELKFGLYEVFNRLSYEYIKDKNVLEFIYKSLVGNDKNITIQNLKKEIEELKKI